MVAQTGAICVQFLLHKEVEVVQYASANVSLVNTVPPMTCPRKRPAFLGERELTVDTSNHQKQPVPLPPSSLGK